MIQVSNVTKRYGAFTALDDVSVTVPDGSLTALLGPSGGGKSTLLRVIAGLETPDAGEVVISGRDATRLSPQSREVGFVFQHYAPFKHQTVAGNVGFALKVRRRPKQEIRQRTAELLELVGLSHLANRYPSQLSGGQRQRMALARALAAQPKVLLLDEPFGALDARVREDLRRWLIRLHDEVHVTTIVVTHDQQEAMEVAEQIVVLADGQVQQAGAPDDLYERPANDFVMGFVGPVTAIGDGLHRPHDLELLPEPADDAHEAVVARIAKLGFEVRVELLLSADGRAAYAQLSRAEARGLDAGDVVWVRPEAGAHVARRTVTDDTPYAAQPGTLDSLDGEAGAVSEPAEYR